MKEFIRSKKRSILRFIGFIVFCILFIRLFFSVTYLFRGNPYNYYDRISVVGIKEEPKNTIDVIYVGGSAAFVYWMPFMAYNDYGFTSYDLATNTVQAESLLTYVKYAQKYQNPELYIFDARSFQYYDEEGSEIGLRVSSDSLDIGMTRWKLINRYLKNRNLRTNEFALYWDIAKYHNNYDALEEDKAWNLMDNSMACAYKGCQVRMNWSYMEDPQSVKSTEREELLANNKKTLIELLEYLKSNNMKALFVVCPYVITEEDYKIYNTISDIVADYGYDFLNTNDYYDDMGIDFSTDFYNVNHVNLLGAEKYTYFLEDYLVNHYQLPDHRNDSNYGAWQMLSAAFLDTYESKKAAVWTEKAYADETYDINVSIEGTNDFVEWAALVNDDRYTLVVAGKCDYPLDTLNPACKKAMERIGISDAYPSANYIKIVSGMDMIADNSDGVTSLTSDIGYYWQQVSCTVENGNGEANILIENINYSTSMKDCINVVVFDDYHRNIVDSVCLKLHDGKVDLVR